MQDWSSVRPATQKAKRLSWTGLRIGRKARSSPEILPPRPFKALALVRLIEIRLVEKALSRLAT